MIKCLKNSSAVTAAISSFVFTLIPEKFFEKYKIISKNHFEFLKISDYIDVQIINIIFARISLLVCIFIVVSLIYLIWLKTRKSITIKGNNYSIVIEYGDILRKKNCKRVINFDECFTTKLGNKISDINPKSICGQYLSLHPDLDIQQLIEIYGVKPLRSKSRYQRKTRYASETIVPNDDDLLMAFVPLDAKGKGRFFSRDEYIESLNFLWKELENYYAEKDVCIPILGAGTTVIDSGTGSSISQQDLLDIIIMSYKLSSHKIKSPYKLYIICKKNSGFSINNIDGV